MTRPKTTQQSERELLETALNVLRNTTGINSRRVVWAVADDQRVDAEVGLEKFPVPYAAYIKREVTPGQMGLLLAQIRSLPTPCLLVTRYVTTPVAERLREERIQF